MGTVSTYDECMKLVAENCSEGTIATVEQDGVGKCYCKTDSNMVEDLSKSNENCLLSSIGNVTYVVR